MQNGEIAVCSLHGNILKNNNEVLMMDVLLEYNLKYILILAVISDPSQPFLYYANCTYNSTSRSFLYPPPPSFPKSNMD